MGELTAAVTAMNEREVELAAALEDLLECLEAHREARLPPTDHAVGVWRSKLDRLLGASENRLEPCPFCGGRADIAVSSDGYGVECRNESCMRTVLDERPTETDAIAAWNSRADFSHIKKDGGL